MRQVVSIVTSVWCTLFLMARIVDYRKLLITARQHFEDDSYTLSLCRDVHVRSLLGRNADICERAEVNVKIPPWQQAMHQLFHQSYLCGTTPCTAIITDMTSSLNGLVFSIVVLIAIPYLLIRMFQRPTHHTRLPLHLTNEKYIKHD